MTKRIHLLRSALLALLALAVISGGSLAGGDLFDKDYSDCPHRTRLRDGQISGLTVARDAEEEDEVNVSWAVTDASAWGLGPNAYNASLVVLLDDGKLHTKTLALGTTKIAFDGIETGKTVKIQMAIVVDHADGDYLISDILEASINQSLTEPAFTTGFLRVTTLDNTSTTDVNEFAAEAVPMGTLYYLGYNENFGNYRANGLLTSPNTPRFRIGLAHSANETNGERDDVDFEAYVIRIEDEGGDRVFPHDVATVASGSAYGARKLVAGQTGTALADNATAFGNVRINDGGKISIAMQNAANADVPFTKATITPANMGLSFVGVKALRTDGTGDVYAEPPQEYRDLPRDVLTTDTTYKLTAWAENDDDEIISPVASLTVRPRDELKAITDIDDYFDTNGTGLTNTYVVEFTVLK